MRARTCYAAMLVGITIASARSEVRPVQFNVVYSCSSGRTKLKVLSCTGTADGDSCDAQYVEGAHIGASYKSLTDLLQTCVVERSPAKPASAPPAATSASAPPAGTPQSRVPPRPPASAAATRPPVPQQPPAAAARPPQAPATQSEAFGIKLGDTVDFAVAAGWWQGKVIGIMGNNFRIRMPNGSEVTKTYPAEVRRLGKPNAIDQANGVYEAGQRVQVLFEGRWVDSKIESTMGMEYQVHIPGNRLAWTTAQNIRPAAPAPPPPPKTRGAPCGSKLEGRWGSATGLGGVTLEIRGAKAYMQGPLMDREAVDCVISGNKIFLTKPGDPNELSFDLNDDGTIDAGAFGDLKRKGK